MLINGRGGPLRKPMLEGAADVRIHVTFSGAGCHHRSGDRARLERIPRAGLQCGARRVLLISHGVSASV